MTDTEPEENEEEVEWNAYHRQHYLIIAVMSFGFAGLMLDLDFSKTYAVIGGVCVIAYILDGVAETYIRNKHK